jgi:hypothetical protein
MKIVQKSSFFSRTFNGFFCVSVRTTSFSTFPPSPICLHKKGPREGTPPKKGLLARQRRTLPSTFRSCLSLSLRPLDSGASGAMMPSRGRRVPSEESPPLPPFRSLPPFGFSGKSPVRGHRRLSLSLSSSSCTIGKRGCEDHRPR